MPTQPIRFFHRGAVVEVFDAAPTRTVLDWLREDARCTGTKEGCNEGDCGACTVVIGEAAAPGDASAVRGLSLQTVNACIQFLPTLDGKALFTVEDLKAMNAATDDELHPVQRAMVECHGSQCGFCTPGFVMSLWSTYEHHRAAVEEANRAADRLLGHGGSGGLRGYPKLSRFGPWRYTVISIVPIKVVIWRSGWTPTRSSSTSSEC